MNFLTEPGDLVVDLFAGSCTTGEVAENLGRFWLGFDFEASYLDGARFRFEEAWDEDRRAQVTGTDGGNGSVVPEAQQALPFDLPTQGPA